MSKFLATTLSAAGLLALASSPSHAVLQIAATINGANFVCVDETACDQTPGVVGLLTTGNVTVGGVSFNGSQQIQTNGPPQNSLNTTSFAIINNTGALANIQFAVGGTDFPGPVSSFSASGSGTWQNAPGSTIDMTYWADPTNTQGADNATDTPGTQVAASGLIVAGPGTDAYDFTQPGVFAMTGPYSWTMEATGTLVNGGILLGRAQNIIADVTSVPVPEPSSLAMMIGSLASAGFWFNRRRRKNEDNVGFSAA